MNVTQEAVDTIEEVARVTLGWPRHHRWGSAHKDARWQQIEETVAAEDIS